MIQLTENAKVHLSTYVGENQLLRLAVIGGGCSGLMYKMEVVEESTVSPKDQIHDTGLFKIVVDPKSALFLKGTEVDYDFGLNGGGLKFNNPLSKQSCGCGKSFC